jgi:ankyrin repeat protein
MFNRPEFVKWLVTKRRVNVYKLSNNGHTPHSLAINYNSPATASFLQHVIYSS